MPKIIEITLTPRQAADSTGWKAAICHHLHIQPGRLKHFNPIQKSIDARSAQVKIRLKVEVFVDEHPISTSKPVINYQDVNRRPPVIIVGMGPAGIFAALKLIELGLKPVILERGRSVKDRKQDLAVINRNLAVNPESNYCFGEGGAGTYSDGKLYTRSTKRGNVPQILQILTEHGADPEILIGSHPHIGTDKLPPIIARIRETILDHGGEIHFNTKVVDLIIKNNKIRGVETQDGQKYEAHSVIVATGHSARDIYELFRKKGLALESKSFALGVRAEHPQELIDSIQYHQSPRNEFLPAATYSLVKQIDNRGVFSFCMCPGGIIVPASTSESHLVVNGMSNSRRNSPYANSGIVVQVHPEDIPGVEKYGAFAGIEFQQHIETLCWQAGGGSQQAPAQRITDFTSQKSSSTLPGCSYNPGIVSAPLHELLPQSVSSRLQEAFRQFDNSMKGYHTSEALILGTESRTSSPVRIPRNAETCEHIEVQGLYPCGEGAGYAGGIVSSALDGVTCAMAVAKKWQINTTR